MRNFPGLILVSSCGYRIRIGCAKFAVFCLKLMLYLLLTYLLNIHSSKYPLAKLSPFTPGILFLPTLKLGIDCLNVGSCYQKCRHIMLSKMTTILQFYFFNFFFLHIKYC